MDASQIDIFKLAERRLAWLDQRQVVLAQNVANASTPGYQPSDLPPFASTLDRFGTLQLATPNPGDIAGITGGPLQPVRETAAHGPDGNGVSLDTQLTNIANTETSQSLVTSIYKKYMTLFGQALGQG